MTSVSKDIVPGMAKEIEDRRVQRGFSPGALATATGITLQGLAPLRKGHRRNYQDRLKLPVCAALGWTPDSIDRLMRGQQPKQLKKP